MIRPFPPPAPLGEFVKVPELSSSNAQSGEATYRYEESGEVKGTVRTVLTIAPEQKLVHLHIEKRGQIPEQEIARFVTAWQEVLRKLGGDPQAIEITPVDTPEFN